MTEIVKKRLQEKYPNVEIVALANLGDTDRAAADTEKVSFQISAVTEYYTLKEMQAKGRRFMWNMNKFIYEVPFTASGTTHAGEMDQQYKRKCILTLEKSFPYIKKRLRVIEKTDVILSPIECSTEIIEGRCVALQAEVNRGLNANTKTLQIVLQGSVLLQVNLGPLEICRAFLSESSISSGRYKLEHINKLKETLGLFAALCGEALELNHSLITADPVQLQYHEEMSMGYKTLLDTLQNKYGVVVPPPSKPDNS